MRKGTETRTGRRIPPAVHSARQWLRSNVGVALALIVMAGVEAFGLRNGSLGTIAIAAVGGLAVTLVVARFSMVNIALFTTYAAAFTLTWNGWFVGPARPADVLAIVAVVFFYFAHRGGELPRLPRWIWQLVLVVLVVLALNIVFRPDARYISSRIIYKPAGIGSDLTTSPFVHTNLSVALKFVIATALVPFAFVFAATYSQRMVRRLVVLFCLGSAISGWVAIFSLYGVTTLNRLTGLIIPGAPRQLGMAYQPNYLAAGVVLAIPIGIWLLLERTPWSRWMGLFITTGCLLGAYASGSRGGAVCAAGAVAVSLVVVPNARRFVVPSLLVAATAVNGIVLLVPAFGAKVLKATRLVGAGATTDPSNQARSIAAHQAWRDFLQSPLHGLGYQVSFDAQTVYLQLLQSGGLLLFTSLMVYNFGAIIAALRMIKADSMAAALAASVISSLALDIFEADITDRFYFVPIAAVVALRFTLSASERAAAEEPATSPPERARSRERTVSSPRAAPSGSRQPIGAAR